MKPFSRDWNMFTGGFLWAFACGSLMGCVVFSWIFSDSLDKQQEKKCPDPLMEMAEYKWVVHSLDRCNGRLYEQQQDNFVMKDEVDHWHYISRLVDSADPDTKCMILVERATRDFRWEAEDELYRCQEAWARECWSPWGPTDEE
jgi:hypothetical protein